jgi:maltose O-acetyltransferase
VNYGLVALDVASIAIGDDVQIGPNVQLLTPTHSIDPDTRRAKWEAAEPIAIASNVWLGGGASCSRASRSGRTPWSAPGRS